MLPISYKGCEAGAKANSVKDGIAIRHRPGAFPGPNDFACAE